MSSTPFPEHLDALKLFARKGVISAALPVSRLKRFSGYLHQPSGEVAVLLEFGHDEEGRKLLSGTLAATVQVLCQRCMGPMPLRIASRLALLVSDGDSEPESAALETVSMTDGNLDVAGLIEDELILSLPLAPAHEDNECSTALNTFRQQTLGREQEQVSNPFSVLASLKGASANIEDDNSKT
jgi:uncharacterized protein